MSENKKVDPLAGVQKITVISPSAPMGEYILYSEAAKIIAEMDSHIKVLETDISAYILSAADQDKRHKALKAEAVKDKNLWKERAEAAEKAFAAQSRKLQAVLPIPGVRAALIELLGMPIPDKPTCLICGSTSDQCGCY